MHTKIVNRNLLLSSLNPRLISNIESLISFTTQTSYYESKQREEQQHKNKNQQFKTNRFSKLSRNKK